jgi:hypothetical protein
MDKYVNRIKLKWLVLFVLRETKARVNNLSCAINDGLADQNGKNLRAFAFQTFPTDGINANIEVFARREARQDIAAATRCVRTILPIGFALFPRFDGVTLDKLHRIPRRFHRTRTGHVNNRQTRGLWQIGNRLGGFDGLKTCGSRNVNVAVGKRFDSVGNQIHLVNHQIERNIACRRQGCTPVCGGGKSLQRRRAALSMCRVLLCKARIGFRLSCCDRQRRQHCCIAVEVCVCTRLG